MGYLLFGPDWGTPHPDWARVPPIWDLGLGYPRGMNLGPVTGVPPRKDMGPVEILWDGDGVPALHLNRKIPVKT